MTRFQTRGQAINHLGDINRRWLRDMRTHEEMRDWLTRNIDLAWFPAQMADKLAHSDRAWNRFLNDIIKSALAYE